MKMLSIPIGRLGGLMLGAALLFAAGCGSSNQTAPQTPPKAAATAAPAAQTTPAATATPASTPKTAATSSAAAGNPAGKTAEKSAAAGLPDKAPETYKVRFDLSNGTVVAEFHKDWAPIGAEHFYQLVKSGFFNGARFFRVVPGFIVQFGIAGDPQVDAKWADRNIKDEPVKHSNTRGTITFAKSSMPNSRSTQMFINLGDNSGPPAYLDRQGFSPIGEVIQGMDVVDKINSQYGERPNQQLAHQGGNAYFIQNFPKLDYIKKATIIQ